jgi:hypothetical protein
MIAGMIKRDPNLTNGSFRHLTASNAVLIRL